MSWYGSLVDYKKVALAKGQVWSVVLSPLSIKTLVGGLQRLEDAISILIRIYDDFSFASTRDRHYRMMPFEI